MMGRAVTLLAAFTVLLFVWFGVSPPAESPRQSRGESASRPQNGPHDSEYPEELSPEALHRLERWLRRGRDDGRGDSSTQDIFHTSSEPATGPPSLPAAPTPSAGSPRLVGFVFPESRAGEALAAVQFEGAMWLVGAGERLGPYLVRQVVAGEGVTLFDEASGGSLQLVFN